MDLYTQEMPLGEGGHRDRKAKLQSGLRPILSSVCVCVGVQLYLC